MMSTNPGSSTFSLKGKRKKKIPANANPLFTQWLQEWKDEANEKGWKSMHTYGKALKTLKLFPLPLESGKDCKLLQNFGDKICKMLDEKLQQYKLNGGTLPPAPQKHKPTSTINVDGSSISSSTAVLPTAQPNLGAAAILTEKQDLASMSSMGSSNSRMGIHTISDDSGSDTDKDPPPRKRKAPSGDARDYVPTYRSGPYALVLSLYRTMQNAGYRGFMLKAELCEAAQPLADKSFTIPDPGSRYTAWSSMGTLIRKGLISKYSNPAKFFLTEKGQALAQRLEEAEIAGASNPRSTSNSVAGDSLRSPNSSNSVASFSSPVSPGCQVFKTGNADLDAALNIRLNSRYQSARVLTNNNDHDQGDADMNAALQRSLIVRSYEDHKRIEDPCINVEDTDLEAALKASLEMSLLQNGSYEKKSVEIYQTSSTKKSATFDKLGKGGTDLEAALKASLAETSENTFVPNKPVAVNSDDNSVPALATNVFLESSHSVSSPSGERTDVEDSEEDEDMKRAIAESLLSYSQELSTSQSSHLNDDDENMDSKVMKSGSERISASKNTSDKAPVDQCVLVVSDDDDDDDNDNIFVPWKQEKSHKSPSNLPKRPHSVSPSPSPPPCALPNLSKSPFSETMKVSTVPFANHQKTSPSTMSHNNIRTVPVLNLNVSTKCEEEVVIIPDVDEDNNDINKKVWSNLTVDSVVDSDDELPDLEAPLFQRLLNKGNIHPDLLKNVAMSSKQQIDKNSSSYSVELSNNDNVLSSKTLFKNKIGSTSSGTSKTVAHNQPNTDINSVSSLPLPDTCFSHQPNSSPVNVIAHSDSTQASAATPLLTSLPTTEQSVINFTPDFTLLPGTFDIVLCLDNREFYGSKSSCKTLLPDLLKSGVQCDLRLLHVGDLLWVARERMGPQIDRVQGRELVLSYIVERKRMDDLVSSLTDGRMKEQKFRLKHCGLNETIILIEEYGSIQNFSLSEDRIKQSIVNSQMIDGFKVKRCASAKDAVSYLSIMTRFLQQNLCSKTLHAVSVEQMKTLKGRQGLHSAEQYLAPFTAFNEAAIKHKDLTVTELFAKQLIQVPGVSAERARAITNIYPTLSLLMDAYKKCESNKESEKLLSTIKYGKNERNLGMAVSRMLHMLYAQKDGLS